MVASKSSSNALVNSPVESAMKRIFVFPENVSKRPPYSARMTTYTKDAFRVKKVAPGLHDEGIVHGNDEDLTSISETRMGEVAGNVFLRASRTCVDVSAIEVSHVLLCKQLKQKEQHILKAPGTPIIKPSAEESS